jgi:hypothetical protein
MKPYQSQLVTNAAGLKRLKISPVGCADVRVVEASPEERMNRLTQAG